MTVVVYEEKYEVNVTVHTDGDFTCAGYNRMTEESRVVIYADTFEMAYNLLKEHLVNVKETLKGRDYIVEKISAELGKCITELESGKEVHEEDIYIGVGEKEVNIGVDTGNHSIYVSVSKVRVYSYEGYSKIIEGVILNG